MSGRNIEFESTVSGWKLTIPFPTDALISELVALDPKPDAREGAVALINRIMEQLTLVLRTAIRVDAAQPESPSPVDRKLTAEAITLEEAGHILQAVRTEHAEGAPSDAMIWLQDERIRNYGRRGMGQMYLGALLLYAERLERQKAK